MKGKLCKGVFLAAGIGLYPFSAQAWWAWNHHEVLPVSQGVWEVVSRVGSGPQDYWCGIGDFAIRQLRSSATQRIYIWEGIGPSKNRPGRKSVKFALVPPPGADTSTGYSLSIKRVGDNLSASLARNYCYDRIEDPFFLRP
ncbi:hypothetical protein PXK00_18385 [Phaeobacter sp. QD34_3]|uniref:hypothetical protein n=1 Tax=unclassified Phaeobacter TaxID=2621772 RepID=UPI00237FBD3E|nr:MULTISPECIES: hypothetical protein [unclassified Phaeobacter]MDE4135082.1 hypothetical protein [Phaeobacter sp. QD34_3]MDE4138712.1 hypothetical protein [Phaeobacter sp. QD34_24]MDE4173419.1 hypothetical protein [Phaeobacter sp. PT47_59]